MPPPKAPAATLSRSRHAGGFLVWQNPTWTTDHRHVCRRRRLGLQPRLLLGLLRDRAVRGPMFRFAGLGFAVAWLWRQGRE